MDTKKAELTAGSLSCGNSAFVVLTFWQILKAKVFRDLFLPDAPFGWRFTMKRTHSLPQEDSFKVFAGKQNRASVTILVVDPGEARFLDDLKGLLGQCSLVHHREHQAAWKLFLTNSVDLVLLDHTSRYPCFQLLSQCKMSKPSIPVIVMTNQGSETIAVKAFRLGARDYFTKPLQLDKLQLALGNILGACQAAESSSSALSVDSLELAFQHIHSHFKSPLSLGQVAETAGMSVSSLVRGFKKKTTLTFVDYINCLRLSHACKLIKESKLSLLEIALTSGFNNQSHFNRVFKKIYGLTPGEYRRATTGKK